MKFVGFTCISEKLVGRVMTLPNFLYPKGRFGTWAHWQPRDGLGHPLARNPLGREPMGFLMAQLSQALMVSWSRSKLAQGSGPVISASDTLSQSQSSKELS